MNRHRTPILGTIGAIAAVGALVAAALLMLPAQATQPTPAPEVSTIILAKSLFQPIQVTARTPAPDRWKAQLKTRGHSDVYVVDNKFPPGASTGWHSHPGPSLILVVTGTVINYPGDDPSCTPHTYSAGDGSSIRAVETSTCCATTPATPQRRRSQSSCYRRTPLDGSPPTLPAAVPPSVRRTAGGWAAVHPPPFPGWKPVGVQVKD